MFSEVLVIYDYPGDALLVFQFRADPKIQALLVECHNKYIGANELNEEHRQFIQEFPNRYEQYKVLDNSERDSRWISLGSPISFVFLMGNFKRERTV